MPDNAIICREGEIAHSYALMCVRSISASSAGFVAALIDAALIKRTQTVAKAFICLTMLIR